MATPKKPELFSFAYFSNYQISINYLASMTPTESWDFSGSRINNFAILKNYLEYTFKKTKEEKIITYTADNKFTCFNTGLVTSNLEEIYALFEENNTTFPDSSPFFFRAFLKESDGQLLSIFSGILPKRSNYFNCPEELIFNPNCSIIPDLDHIITDNIDRFPPHLKSAGDSEIRRQLMGAIDEVKKQVKTNYKIAVPQYYRNKIQLLLPLCLTAGSPNPDLALVIYKVNATTYCARTCLTLQMAYTNARLIVRPQSEWLKP